MSSRFAVLSTVHSLTFSCYTMTTAKINTTIENRIHKDFTSVHTHNGCVIKLLCCSWQKSECDLCRGRCDRDRDG